MIRDYKSRLTTQRPRHRGKVRILAAAGFLALAVGAVRYLDLTELVPLSPAIADEAPLVSNTLSLPGIEPVADSDLPAPPEAAAAETPAPDLGEPATELPAAAADIELAMIDAADDAPSLLADPLPAELGSESPANADEPLEVEVTPAEPELRWVEYKVAKGDSLARIFSAQGLDAKLLHRIVNSDEHAKDLARIRPGQMLRFQFDENNELSRLELHRNKVDSLRVAISDDAVRVEQVSKSVDKHIATAAGVIESSLFVDGQKAGLSDGQIMELAAIFGWDVDFALEIRAGDQFRVVFEEHYLDGEKLRDGAILAAEFTNRGTTHRAVRYEDTEGEASYYDVDGHNKRRAFIRTPIKFARISSRYNPRRWHPVLKTWRSHKGVDYAAPTGTPVKATGDGRVVHRGTKGGYGKTVILEHAGKYTTLYAHLSSYSKRARPGNRVKQGQVIGYVGQTGLASGPHLHYEFRVNGAHKDPLRVKLPKTLSLPKSEIARFRETTAPLLARLEAISAETMVASADSTESR